MLAEDLIPLPIAQLLADTLAGRPLNGNVPTMVAPPWRVLVGEMSRAPLDTATNLDNLLGREGYTDTERRDILEYILSLKPGTPAKEQSPLRILCGDELLEEPNLTWLLDDLLPVGAFASMVGTTGKGKTFLAVEIALRIAQSGRPVLYVVGEGQFGIKARYQAWRKYYNNEQPIPNIYWIKQPVYVQDDAFLTQLYASMALAGCSRPALTIFDTLSMCFIGNENGTEDMKAYVDAVSRFKLRTGSAVMPIVHTGWNETRMGGNRKLQNGLDVEMFVDQDELGTISLSCTKMRDADPFSPRYFTLEKVEGTTSCVLMPAEAASNITVAMPVEHRTLYDLLVQAGMDGLTLLEISAARLVPASAVGDILKDLEKASYIRSSAPQGTVGRRFFAQLRDGL